MATKNKKKTAQKTKDVLTSLENTKQKKAEKPAKKSGNKVEDYINFLRALASPERLSILKALESQEMCTSDVEQKFFMEQSTASHHLNTLLKANIVSCRKTGRRVFYHVNEKNIYENYKSFLKALESVPKSKDKTEYKTH
ncbi:ArsR/SmtB family transcription factor [Candidatus Margulisiibacteriota bacterium]